ncbi:chloride channel protein, partial [Mesorhizobium sp. M1A.T.Ca.IN.004.03.1.1]
VGWIRNLTVDKLMRADVKTARAGISLEEFKQAFPIGSTQRVILVEESDKYAGLVLVPEIYANPTDAQDEGKTLADFIHYRNDFLQPQMNARQAAAIFDKSESEALAVVNNLIERKVIGQLSESYTLRRYSEELD